MYKIGDKVRFKKDYYIGGTVVSPDATFVIAEVNPLGDAKPHYILKDHPDMIVLDKELAPAKEEMFRIEIEEFYGRRSHGVRARKYANDVLVAEGIARCHPEDVFDFNVGSAMAMERMCKAEYAGAKTTPTSATKGITAIVRCIKSPYYWWTLGATYKVVDGVIRDDCGSEYPRRHDGDKYCFIEELTHIGNDYKNNRNFFEVLKVL